jgi:hypothetical protein
MATAEQGGVGAAVGHDASVPAQTWHPRLCGAAPHPQVY